ncbi:MAG: S-layer homology domain-containing protein [Clostridiales bacterium]|jgi:hypothetical protein|nr:S-layer homology domain-containing protein [Clostridiales bacterium]
MKLLCAILFSVFILTVECETSYALAGDLGFFGGVSEGRRLPKTIETLTTGEARTESNPNQPRAFVYKEMIFLSGRPVEFTGLIEMTGAAGVTGPNGSYTQQFSVYASPGTEPGANIERTVVFNINYRTRGNELIKDYTLQDWTETITLDGETFALDTGQSGFDVSIIEHNAPGITYYRGDVSRRAVYTSNDERYTLDSSDAFYGYNCAWSASETHRTDVTLLAPYWQTQYQIRPSATVSKSLEYTSNEPEAIGFEGNYKEVIHRDAGLKYDILQPALIYPDQPPTGGAFITQRNTFEQLASTDLSFLKGSAAYEDISRLYAMQILEGDPKFYAPDQSITRAQFVTALVKAVKLPVQTLAAETRGRKAQSPPIVFPDVLPTRPDYPYIMSAYRNGVAFGRDFGTFYADEPIERQEAFTIIIRALGLSGLGQPAPAFADDDAISSWAKRDLSAAKRLGIIKPYSDGSIRPHNMISKAEAAALLTGMTDYMRACLPANYSDHLVNYTL